ncbi:NAD(P)/FAD-dependent oxidoreductase [Paenalkalicoccus suaedae]|uniref:NAD(P)/FAD-dependent oxidoreductase n=1 Tax=Paenalkalicoccus suaedae TaxID=2592382 RepID=A0A859FFP2_9BACI|nr:NAD(P)/FAD-dependent oxidoreductase [Paenalkalicoccus suaedae]QKS72183.1 NAD(P)/FAD-dependent oxidoreductase [Paenalkalicoccus suaedae]
MHHVVILGGGYGGLRVIQRLLAEKDRKDFRITLVEREPYHSLKTEFYALAAGTVADNHLRIPFPEDDRLELVYDLASNIRLEDNIVELGSGKELPYDELIIGLGCEDKHHGVPGAEENSLSIQSMRRARKSNQIIQKIRHNGRVSIVGGGLSGVETAAELRESRPDLEIFLFDRGANILSMFPKKLYSYVTEWFVENDVTIVNHANITKVERHMIFNHDEPMEMDAIIWTAGVQPNKVARELDVEKDRLGRLVVTIHHHLPNYENAFVVGDCASSTHAPSAQLAEAQGDQIAMLLFKKWDGEPYPEKMPRIKLKGVLGSLGKKHGFGLMGEKSLVGRVPRVLKSGVLWMYKHHSGS